VLRRAGDNDGNNNNNNYDDENDDNNRYHNALLCSGDGTIDTCTPCTLTGDCAVGCVSACVRARVCARACVRALFECVRVIRVRCVSTVCSLRCVACVRACVSGTRSKPLHFARRWLPLERVV
jgi:hypothetical protein